jgi:hypothetical protein
VDRIWNSDSLHLTKRALWCAEVLRVQSLSVCMRCGGFAVSACQRNLSTHFPVGRRLARSRPRTTMVHTEGLEFLPCPCSGALERWEVSSDEAFCLPASLAAFTGPRFPRVLAIALLPSLILQWYAGSSEQEKWQVLACLAPAHLIASRSCVMEVSTSHEHLP